MSEWTEYAELLAGLIIAAIAVEFIMDGIGAHFDLLMK
jgi:small neutral amino acid transporter SnatA (MarC family)